MAPYDIGDDHGGGDGLYENLGQREFSVEKFFLLLRPAGICPEQPDHPPGPVLWVKVKNRPKECSSFCLFQPDPGEPGHDVVH